MIALLLLALLLLSPAYAADRAPYLPDSELTPGAVSDLTAEQICAKSYHTRDVRSVTAAMKREVFTSYGIACRPLFGNSKRLPRCGTWEIDHLDSLELAGLNAIRNLWPQKMTGPWNARMKDKVENRAHREVCAGKADLADVQKQIATDWRELYRKYFGEPE